MSHPERAEPDTPLSDAALMLIMVAAPVAMLTYVAIALWIGFHG